MSVRETAGAAWGKVVAAHESAEAAKQAAAERKEELRRTNAAYVIAHSPLTEWFPDATFEVVDYTGVGTSLQYHSDGSDIIVRSDDNVLFGLSMNLRDAGWGGGGAACTVHIVHLHSPTGYYASDGPYYTGPEVKSVEDVGRYLAGRRA